MFQAIVEKDGRRLRASHLFRDEDAVHHFRQPGTLQLVLLGGRDTVGDRILAHLPPQGLTDIQRIIQKSIDAPKGSLVSLIESLYVHALNAQFFEQQKKASRQKLLLRHFSQFKTLPIIIIDLNIQANLLPGNLPPDRAEALRQRLLLGTGEIKERIVHVPKDSGEPTHCCP